ncbi:MAG: hypothetical protein JXR76_15325 [Deltaproteobacteria bacterium]|nr:hypothetical protein [Deltaproteobacteria bacterium]
MPSKKKSKKDENRIEQGSEDELLLIDTELIDHLKKTACWEFTKKGIALFQELFPRWQNERKNKRKEYTEVYFAIEIMVFERGVNSGGASANMKKVVAGKKRCNGWSLYRLVCEFNRVFKADYKPSDFAKAVKTGRVSTANLEKSKKYMDELWNLYPQRIAFEPEARSLFEKYKSSGARKSLREIMKMFLRDFRETIANQHSMLGPVAYWLIRKWNDRIIVLARIILLLGLIIPSDTFIVATNKHGGIQVIERSNGSAIVRDEILTHPRNVAGTQPIHVDEKGTIFDEQVDAVVIADLEDKKVERLEVMELDTVQEEMAIGSPEENEKSDTADIYIETNLGEITVSVSLMFDFSVFEDVETVYNAPAKYFSTKYELYPDNDARCSYNGNTYLCKVAGSPLGIYEIRFSDVDGYISPKDVSIELKNPSAYIERIYLHGE